MSARYSVWLCIFLSSYSVTINADTLPSPLPLSPTQITKLQQLLHASKSKSATKEENHRALETAKTNTNLCEKITAPTTEEMALAKTCTITPITLTRFAAQQLYAPERLLTPSQDIYRVPMHTKKTVDLVMDGSITAMPLASWRGGNFFVTAILLRNNLPQVLSLKPEDLCGQWQTATFFPINQLTARGTVNDSTTVFLVSRRSFVESLNNPS